LSDGFKAGRIMLLQIRVEECLGSVSKVEMD
jgi:hypothetical protein